MLSKAQLTTIAANLAALKLDAATPFRVIAALGPLILDGKDSPHGAGDALKTKANSAANGEKKLAARRRP